MIIPEFVFDKNSIIYGEKNKKMTTLPNGKLATDEEVTEYLKGEEKKRNTKKYIVIALVVLVVLYFIFRKK